ncbi:unnamed protein product [Arctogadus glacialis]
MKPTENIRSRFKGDFGLINGYLNSWGEQLLKATGRPLTPRLLPTPDGPHWSTTLADAFGSTVLQHIQKTLLKDLKGKDRATRLVLIGGCPGLC